MNRRRPDINCGDPGWVPAHHNHHHQNLNLNNNNNIPIHLLFPQPIPEPPRVINSRPLIGDLSITSDQNSSVAPKVKLKTPAQTTTTSKSTNSEMLNTNSIDDLLQKIRLKHGLLDNLNNKTPSQQTESDKSPKEEEEEQSKLQIRNRLESIQQNLRKQLDRLQISDNSKHNNNSVGTMNLAVADSKMDTKCKCTKEDDNLAMISVEDLKKNSQFSSTTTTREMIEYIKRQDQRLNTISQQIEHLIRLNQHNQGTSLPTTGTLSTTSTSTATKTSNKRTGGDGDLSDLVTITNHHQNHSIVETRTTSTSPLSSNPNSPTRTTKTRNRVLIEKRSIQTMTSFIAEKQSSVGSGSRNPNKKPQQRKQMQQTDFLDTSIEKVRQDLRKNLQSLDSPNKDPPIIIRSRIRRATNLSEKNCQQLPTDQQQIYHNTLATVNSILVRNGSFESSSTQDETINENSSSTFSSIASNGKRSSCSNTPSSEFPNFLQEDQQHHRISNRPRATTSSPKSKITRKSNKDRNGYRLLSEQSLYIERLASKYQCSAQEKPSDYFDDFDDLILESVQKSSTNRIRNCRNNILRKYDLNIATAKEDREDFERYALTDHNSSIATKDYLQKYGLTLNNPSKSKSNQLKIDTPLIEETEDDGEEEEEVELEQNHLPERIGKIREIKSRPGSAGAQVNYRINVDKGCGDERRLNRILDLDAIKSLPKLI